MGRRFPVLGLLALVGVLAGALGLLVAAYWNPEPTAPLPPSVVLRTSAGAEQTGARGSSCWSAGNVTGCGDGPPVILATPLTIEAGAVVRLDFARLPPPTEVRYTVYHYDKTVGRAEPEPRASIALIDPGEPVQQGSLSLAPAIDLPLDLPPGEYALLIFSRHSQGDTSQGFYFSVR